MSYFSQLSRFLTLPEGAGLSLFAAFFLHAATFLPSQKYVFEEIAFF